jgi:hypothetical protein
MTCGPEVRVAVDSYARPHAQDNPNIVILYEPRYLRLMDGRARKQNSTYSGEGMMKPKKSRLQSFLKLVAWYDCGTGCSFKCYYFRGTTQFSSDSADNNGPEFHQTESCLFRNRQHHIPMQFGKHDWHAYNVHVRAARFSFRFASRRISHPRPRSRRRRIGCF